MVNIQNAYHIITSYEDFLYNVVQYYVIDFDDPPSYPCLIDIFIRGEEITYKYTEVCDLEGATRQYYIDEDPEYSVLLDVAYDMMFAQSKIEDSTKGE